MLNIPLKEDGITFFNIFILRFCTKIYLSFKLNVLLNIYVSPMLNAVNKIFCAITSQERHIIQICLCYKHSVTTFNI